eukprot:874180-Pyramimonas_sp.AAC.1
MSAGLEVSKKLGDMGRGPAFSCVFQSRPLTKVSCGCHIKGIAPYQFHLLRVKAAKSWGTLRA